MMIFSIHADWDEWTSFFSEKQRVFPGSSWEGDLKPVPGCSVFEKAVKREKQWDWACAQEFASSAGSYWRGSPPDNAACLPIHCFSFWTHHGSIQRGPFQGSGFNWGCQGCPHDWWAPSAFWDLIGSRSSTRLNTGVTVSSGLEKYLVLQPTRTWVRQPGHGSEQYFSKLPCLGVVWLWQMDRNNNSRYIKEWWEGLKKVIPVKWPVMRLAYSGDLMNASWCCYYCCYYYQKANLENQIKGCDQSMHLELGR